jgi:hypothetical protein
MNEFSFSLPGTVTHLSSAVKHFRNSGKGWDFFLRSKSPGLVFPTFLQTSPNITKKRCANPRCRCAQEGPLLEVTLLTWKEENRTRKGSAQQKTRPSDRLLQCSPP